MLFRCVMGFVCQHSLFGAAAARTFLTPDFFDACALGGGPGLLDGLDLIQQQLSSYETVKALLACGLAFDLKARGPMTQEDTRGGLIDILPPMSARTDKSLIEIRFAHTQCSHALGNLSFLLRADW